MATGTDLIQAGETLERLAMQYEGIYTASIALKGIGSLSNHLVELTAKREAILAELDLIKATSAQSLLDGQALKDQLADELIAFHDARNAEWADAKAKAADLITNANATADALRKAAQDEADATTTAMTQTIADETTRLEVVRAELDQARVDRDAALAALTEAQANRQQLLHYLDVMRSLPVA